jgi:hypothetical protein
LPVSLPVSLPACVGCLVDRQYEITRLLLENIQRANVCFCSQLACLLVWFVWLTGSTRSRAFCSRAFNEPMSVRSCVCLLVWCLLACLRRCEFDRRYEITPPARERSVSQCLFALVSTFLPVSLPVSLLACVGCLFDRQCEITPPARERSASQCLFLSLLACACLLCLLACLCEWVCLTPSKESRVFLLESVQRADICRLSHVFCRASHFCLRSACFFWAYISFCLSDMCPSAG